MARLSSWLFAPLLWAGFACSGAQHPKPEKSPCEENCPLTIQVEVSPESNGGTALQFLIRRSSEGAFKRETYSELAAVLSKNEDPETLVYEALVPGEENYEKTIVYPKEGAVGVYFMFSSPSEKWRYLVDKDARTIKFHIGTDRINTVVITQREVPHGAR